MSRNSACNRTSFPQARGGETGQEELTTGPIFEDCNIGVLKFEHSALQGDNGWKTTEGAGEKGKACRKKRKKKATPSITSSGKDD